MRDRAIISPDSDVQIVGNKEWVMEAVLGMSTGEQLLNCKRDPCLLLLLTPCKRSCCKPSHAVSVLGFRAYNRAYIIGFRVIGLKLKTLEPSTLGV